MSKNCLEGAFSSFVIALISKAELPWLLLEKTRGYCHGPVVIFICIVIIQKL